MASRSSAVRCTAVVLSASVVIAIAGGSRRAHASVQAAQAPPAGGVACVALPVPSAETVSVPSADAAAAVRTLMAGYLTGPTIRNVVLDARLPSQALAEARTKDCGYLLTMTLAQKRGGGGSKFFGRMLSDSGTAAAAGIPGFNAGSAAVRAAAIAGAQAAGEMATTTKAKDELRLEYKLQTLDGTVVLPARTEVKKATEDGQDLLTPLVEHAAEAVSAATTKP